MSVMPSETLREIGPELDFGGQYNILSTIREGRLFLAEKAGKRFILKTSDGSAKGLEMLKREYELSIGLQHPGLAYVFGYEEVSPAGPCIVQEFVDGETLAEWLTHRPSVKERRRILHELLAVVGYLHQKGIVHNDLKPDNILIARSGGALKLIDLGFADDDTHTQKALGGTRGYASPELLAGRKVDARSDIWSIGKLLQDIFPGRYRRVVRRCLRENPQQRYASAKEVDAAVRRYHWPLWLAAAAVVVVGIVFYSLTPDELDRAKADVDAWYATEVPAFRQALQDASSPSDVYAAWAALAENAAVINQEIPDRLPESARPALRDYLFARYNETFPALQQEMTERVTELAP